MDTATTTKSFTIDWAMWTTRHRTSSPCRFHYLSSVHAAHSRSLWPCHVNTHAQYIAIFVYMSLGLLRVYGLRQCCCAPLRHRLEPSEIIYSFLCTSFASNICIHVFPTDDFGLADHRMGLGASACHVCIASLLYGVRVCSWAKFTSVK